jgi:hypothetical protein
MHHKLQSKKKNKQKKMRQKRSTHKQNNLGGPSPRDRRTGASLYHIHHGRCNYSHKLHVKPKKQVQNRRLENSTWSVGWNCGNSYLWRKAHHLWLQKKKKNPPKNKRKNNLNNNGLWVHKTAQSMNQLIRHCIAFYQWSDCVDICNWVQTCFFEHIDKVCLLGT